MQKQQEMLEQQKKMQEQHRMEKELMENERLEQIKNKKDGEQSELSPPWPLTSTEQFTVQGHNNRNPSLISQFFHLQENDIFWRHTIFMCLSIENNTTTQFVFSLI